MKNITRSDLKEIIGSFVPPALFVLLVARFVCLNPEHFVTVVFHLFGLLMLLWCLFGKISETFFEDAIEAWMGSMHPLINLFLIIVYYSLIMYLCLVCMVVFNRYVLLLLASVGIYLPMLFFWALFSIPYLKNDAPTEQDEHKHPAELEKTEPQTDNLYDGAVSGTRVLCKTCGVPVSQRLKEPDAKLRNWLSNEKYADGEPLLPRRIILEVELFLEEGECFYGAENSQVILNLNDLVNTRSGGTRSGCCGVDGCDGINTFCINDHPIGIEVSDCYQPEFIHLSTEHIVLESRSAHVAPQTGPEEMKIQPQTEKKPPCDHNFHPRGFPESFSAEMQNKIEAEFLRFARTGGFIDNTIVVSWADRIIAKGEYDPVIIDLSLCGELPPGKVIELLGKIPGHCELAYPIKMLLAYCHVQIRDGKMDSDKLLVKLCRTAMANKVPEPLKNDIDWLEELQYLGKNKQYTTEIQARDEVRQYVSRYAKFERWLPQL